MPRVRFQLRWAMVAVALAAVLVLMGDALRRLSAEYREKADGYRDMAWGLMQGYPGPKGREPQIEYYMQLAAKYERASHCPLLPVRPDSPKPE